MPIEKTMSLYKIDEKQAREDLLRVTLRCPECKNQKLVPRDKTDPPETALVILQCDRCNEGDFDSPMYFAADGRQLGLTMPDDEYRIGKQLKSIVCICGKAKQKTKPFCRRCFTSLPDDLKAALSNQLVEEFATAYTAARERLRTR